MNGCMFWCFRWSVWAVGAKCNHLKNTTMLVYHNIFKKLLKNK